jgi:hypothetical protein
VSLVTTDQFRIVRSAPYDGTNGTELLSQFQGVLVSDSGTLLRFYAQGDPETVYEVPVGWRILWGGPDAFEEVAETIRAFPWAVVPLAGASYRLVTVTGTGAIPASLLGGQQNITVNLAPVHGGAGATLNSSVYTPIADMRGTPTILSGHAIVSAPPLPLSSTQVRVTVQSAAASLAGGSVFVVAQQLQTV